MAKKAKKIKSAAQRKELNQKIAEIIWLAIGGIIGVAGLASLVIGTFISNMSGNFKAHPFYPLYQFQEKFFAWLKSWSKISLSSFIVLGIILVAFTCVYLLIVLFIYANKQDAKEKKNKAKKLREKNLKKFEEERAAAEEAARVQEEQRKLEAAAKAEEAVQPAEQPVEEVSAQETVEETKEESTEETVTEEVKENQAEPVTEEK